MAISNRGLPLPQTNLIGGSMDVPIMNLEQRREASDYATMTIEMRKEIKETFTTLEEILLQRV